MRDLDSIVRDNRDSYRPQPDIRVPVPVFEKMVDALKTARASLDDVIKHGASARVWANIANVDRPRVERAIESAVGVLLRYGSEKEKKAEKRHTALEERPGTEATWTIISTGQDFLTVSVSGQAVGFKLHTENLSKPEVEECLQKVLGFLKWSGDQEPKPRGADALRAAINAVHPEKKV